MGVRTSAPWGTAATILLACGGQQGPTGNAGGTSAPTALVVSSADVNGPCFANESQNRPGWIFLIIASQPITCSQTLPAALGNPCGEGPMVWEVCVALPSSALAVGTVDFTMGMTNVEEQDTGGCSNPGECCAAEDLDGLGSVAISASDSSSVTFKLTARGLAGDSSVSPDGTYTAMRCP